MTHVPRLCAVSMLLFVPACFDSSPSAPGSRAPNLQVSDGAHSAGNTHFFFLPPMVPQPSFGGTFDGSKVPTVQICEWASTACGAPPLANFTMTDGPGSETIRVVPADELYIVNWHSDQFALSPTKSYRIRVLLGTLELGHADVDIVTSGRELRNVDTGEFIPLLNGSTLPIKFRIELGAASDVVFVVDLVADGPGAVFRIDPTTGAQTLVSSGGGFLNPIHIAAEGSGTLVVADELAGAVFRVDPVTGIQTTLSSGGNFVSPIGIAVAASGDILVADNGGGGFSGPGFVVRVNPISGAQTIVSNAGVFVNPTGIAEASNGDIYVIDQTVAALIRVEPTTGAQTIVSSGGLLSEPLDLAIEASGNVVVAEPSGRVASGCDPKVIRINPSTGVQTVVSSGGNFLLAACAGPSGIDVAPNGDIWTAVSNASVRRIVRIDPVTGAQISVSSGGSFSNPADVVVVP